MSTNLSTRAALRRAGTITAVGGVLLLVGTGTASAHVSANTGGESAERGGHAAVTFRVPNEEQDADTVRLEVEFPKGTPVSSAQTKPVPGWRAEVEKDELPEPVTLENGTKVTEAVTRIVWTAGDNAGIGPDEYGEFDVSMAMPDNTDLMVFPTKQYYDNDVVAEWTTPPRPDGPEEPQHPAPTVDLVAATGDGHGGEHGGASDAGAGSTTADGTDDTARWLGGAGLAVGALGLGLGIGATLRARRASGSGTASSATPAGGSGDDSKENPA
ncbi:uncharacterized protein YcnI [Tamaricihabitans halophyticus]|uniref:Uncharacterized protein YcnI n=1 Tax=Tamaricihabitans halophyticus TaxID=1262583 RepID=A0A4R2QYG9_9PSEU|nr:YcnI family protein [Tamaricihabitans halophyticus]TCP54088.1 uncharacterized protein YcnI [Tamaricihabitans halophyticus]